MEAETEEARSVQASGTTPAMPRPQAGQGSACNLKMWQLLAKRLGRRYADCTLENFDCDGQAEKVQTLEAVRAYLADLKSRVNVGQSVFMFGPPGTGKDHLLVAMMRDALFRDAAVKWSDGSELFGQFRDAIRGTGSESQLVAGCVRPKILAISDPIPPLGDLTPYQSSMFFRIVDQRYRAMRPTWVTINTSDRSEAEKRMSASIVDRLGHDALSLPMMWPSYRQKSNE